jgi:glycosyltransferase involved in cell wall biosynthesis
LGPLRVLHVAQPLDLGVPRVAAEFAADQVSRGWEVAVAAPPGSELHERAAAAGAASCEWQARRAPGPWVAAETARLGRIVDTVAPDLVHLHSAKAGLAGRLALRGRRPTIYQPHSWPFEAAGRLRRAVVLWERLAARWADAIVCVSDDERERGADAGIKGRWQTIPNGVDLAAWTPASAADRAAARATLGLPDGPLAVAVGRLFGQKGYDVLLEAWPAVRSSVPDARLAIVGDGPERETLQGLLSEGAELVGRDERVRDWLAASDVVVIPSRWEAGLSRVAMEAMASARSVVASDFEGMRDGSGGRGGAIVPVGAAPALAEAVAARLGDPDLAAREGEAGRRVVEERFPLERTLEQIATLSESLARQG